MSDFEIIKFNPNFLPYFVYDGIEAEIFEADNVDVNELIRIYDSYGDAWMGIYKGRCLGASGVFPLNKGTGQSWMFMNREVKHFVKSVVRGIRKRQEEIMDRRHYHRLQTPVLELHNGACRLVEMLGYVKESVMTDFGPKRENYIMYAKIRG